MAGISKVIALDSHQRTKIGKRRLLQLRPVAPNVADGDREKPDFFAIPKTPKEHRGKNLYWYSIFSVILFFSERIGTDSSFDCWGDRKRTVLDK